MKAPRPGGHDADNGRMNHAPLMVLAALLDMVQRGQSPSVRELGAACGLRNPEAINGHLRNLKRRGLITSMPHRARTWRPKCRLLFFEEFFR